MLLNMHKQAEGTRAHGGGRLQHLTHELPRPLAGVPCIPGSHHRTPHSSPFPAPRRHPSRRPRVRLPRLVLQQIGRGVVLPIVGRVEPDAVGARIRLALAVRPRHAVWEGCGGHR